MASTMTANLEIISTGNELLIGKIENTNAFWIAKRATQLGVTVKRITVIQDIVPEIASTINEAVARKPQFIVTTGGLGPTFDDKTLQAVAKALNRPLIVNQQALSMVKRALQRYALKRGLNTEIELTLSRIKMATLPQGTEPVNNPIGAAPAVRAAFEETILFALPGVPAEMEAIFKETIAPLLKQATCGNVFCQQSIFVEGTVESCLDSIVEKVMADNKGVYVKSHQLQSEGKPRIELHLTMIDSRDQNPAQRIRKAAGELASLIKEKGGQVCIE